MIFLKKWTKPKLSHACSLFLKKFSSDELHLRLSVGKQNIYSPHPDISQNLVKTAPQVWWETANSRKQGEVLHCIL